MGHFKNCYGPSVIGVTVTKGGHPRGDGLYGTSGAMGRGITESRRQLSTYIKSECGNVTYSEYSTYRRTQRQRTQLLLWGGVMYLSIRSLPLDSSLLFVVIFRI